MKQTNTKAVAAAGWSPVRKSQAGFGMLEVLISLLILAIGLLGLASLQTTSLAQTNEVRNRSQAILLAEDLIERIRSNRSNIDAYDDNAGNAADDDGEEGGEGGAGEGVEDEALEGEQGEEQADAPTCEPDFAISNTGVAADDLAEWKNSLACLLPGGNGFVTVDDGVVTVRLVWGTNGSLQLEARP